MTVVGAVIIVVAVLSSLAVRPKKFYSVFGHIFRIKKYSGADGGEQGSASDFDEKDSVSDG